MFGFIKGFQPFAGYNYGAKQFDRLKKSTRYCMVWSTAFCMIAGIILILFANPIVSIFGTDTEMVLLASKALSLSRQGIFFFPLVFLLPRLFGLSGVISVQPIADFLTTMITVIFAFKINLDFTKGL